MANRGRSVEFSVRAKDEFSKVLKDLERQQTKLSASAKASNRRDLLSAGKDEVKQASDNYKRLYADIERLRTAQTEAARSGKLSSSEMRELGESIGLVRRRSQEALSSLQQKRAALNEITRSSVTGYSAFNRIATVMEKGAVSATKEGAASAAAAVQLNKLNTAANSTVASQANLKNHLNATTAAIQRQRNSSISSKGSGAKGDAQDVEMFGLRPWQMTNLGYQINDVVSGLAMGQRPMQVFAQQAGQIAQIWPDVMVTIVRSIPHILGLSAVLAPFIGHALRLKEAAETMKYFQQQLGMLAGGSDYGAKNLTDIALGMKQIGISADDARTMVASFAKQGLNTGGFREMGRLSKELSNFTGNSVVEESERLTKAFSGNIDAVYKLDEELKFLTADQLLAIDTMNRSGNAAGAAAIAQGALTQKLRESKAESGEWAQAMKSLGEAWDSLVNLAEQTGVIGFLAREFQKFGRDVNNAAKEIKAVTDFLGKVGSPDGLDELDQKISDIAEKMREAETNLGKNQAFSSSVYAASEYADNLKAQYDSLLEQRQLMQKLQQEEERTSKLSTGGAEERARVEAQIQIVVNNRLQLMAEETRLAALTGRELFVQQQLQEGIKKADEEAIRLGKEKLGLTEAQTEEIKKQAGLLYDQRETVEQTNRIGGGTSTVDLIKKYEGYQPTGKWDVNAYRAGYGSDTVTLSDGTIVAITKGMQVSVADANRDLIRRIGEFQGTVKKEIGADRFEAFGREQQAVLTSLAYNYGNLTRTGQLEAFKTGTVDQIADAIQSLGSHNNGINRNRRSGEAELFRSGGTNYETGQHLYELDQKRLETEKEYQKEYQKRIDQQQFELNLASKSAREAAIAKAVRDEELKAAEAKLVLTKEQVAEVERLAAAEFDNKNVNLEVNNLMEQRKALLESLQIAQAAGDSGKIESTVAAIGEVETKLQSAIDKAILFWQSIGGPGADAAILQLNNMSAGIGKAVNDLQTKFLPTAQQLNEQMADIGGNAFSAFAKAIANGENAAQAFFQTLLQGIAEFLIEIGKAIVKQALFNAISGGSGGGGLGGGIFGMVGGLFGARHTGGLIGGPDKMTRMVNPAVFKYADKHHGGGVIGRLGSNERPIIGLVDEEVLTTDDPRHVYNGGGGGQAVNVKNVNVFDPRDVLESALQSVEGERIMMNFMTRNASKINGAIKS